MAYRDFKDLARRTASDRVLSDKAFNIDKNPKNDGQQRGLAYMIYKVFYKKTSGSGIKSMPNQQLVKELDQLFENLEKEKCIHHLKIVFGVLIQLICN